MTRLPPTVRRPYYFGDCETHVSYKGGLETMREREREKSVWITPKATIQGQAQARLGRAQRTIYIVKNQTGGMRVARCDGAKGTGKRGWTSVW